MQFGQLKRREFITLLGGAAAAWPIGAHAQQSVRPMVGFLAAGAPEGYAIDVAALRKGLSDTGYVDGQNLSIEYRWAQNQNARLPELAADLVRRGVAVIVTRGTPAALAAKAATTTIPILFFVGTDPVELGLVASLNRPGGNVTGISDMGAELGAKRLGLLNELLPRAARFAVLVNPNNPTTGAAIADVRAAADAIARQLEVVNARTSTDIDNAFASLSQKRIEAFLINPDALFVNRRVPLVTLAIHHKVPGIYFDRVDAAAGGLMSYGPNVHEQFRQLGIYAGRILKGEKTAELPVSRSTKFEFVINLHTAKLLGIDVPATLLARADEVIE
jgi:ABC-type uncharacterized transport system substrate-binding protein